MARKIPGKSLQQIITSITNDIFVCYYYYMFTRVAEGPEIYFFCLESHRICSKVWIFP